ncbi:uncharacterized protein LOC130655031 [Hydractinia symbiolongicarpus]|uniref:uncharacterized protein LOC130655031 n=1 Tax=Hydractinia symbiolongicarpus TaxID=13093 RepID=UPI0025519BD4|nr:uncharacterized protein LOC130655031 [Hydractinia symbiolongicarpus]
MNTVKDSIPPLVYNFVVWATGKSDSQVINAPDVNNHGWNIDKIVVYWMDTDCAVEMLKELISCECKSGCKKRSCKCLKNELSCTKMCNTLNARTEKMISQNRAKKIAMTRLMLILVTSTLKI